MKPLLDERQAIAVGVFVVAYTAFLLVLFGVAYSLEPFGGDRATETRCAGAHSST